MELNICKVLLMFKISHAEPFVPYVRKKGFLFIRLVKLELEGAVPPAPSLFL
jgi:hypothetical protein